jgi:hypothetical protein
MKKRPTNEELDGFSFNHQEEKYAPKFSAKEDSKPGWLGA